MKTLRNLLFIVICLTGISTKAQNNADDKPIVIANDYDYKDANVHFTGTENLIFLPENRLKKDSRKIAINFFRIKAKNDTGLPPVVYLPGGPGSVFYNYMFGEKYGGKHGAAFGKQMTIVNETRDILIINQRGNPKISGNPEPNFTYKFNAGNPKEITNPKKWGENLRKNFVANANFFNETGMDLRGYDFIHLVDDIESIREYYNYDKISFVAGSFGTQWAIGYMSRYPDNVDRALFYDVEPLSHSDDDPEFVWNVFKRIEERAMNASNLKGKLPKIGLLNAVKAIVKRLEEKPVWVKIESDSILIGANDFKRNLGYPFGSVEAWPKYITELYNGDYRLLALWAKENRGGIGEVDMINSLVNLSLGITKERYELLTNREEAQWMSSRTRVYDALNGTNIVPDIGDEMRKVKSNNIPILILQGDIDMNTPYENAEYLLPYFKNTQIITLKNAAHQGRVHLFEEYPRSLENIMSLFTTDFDKVSFKEFNKTIKSEYDLKEIKFWDIGGKSIYEMRTSN